MDAVLIVAAKSTVILLAAFALAALARRARASVRHAIFAAAFVALLLLPLASALAPEIELPLLDAAPVATTNAQQPAPAATQPRLITTAVAQLPATRWNLADVAIAVYASGAAAILLMLFAGVWRLRRWAADAEPWSDATAEDARVLLSDRVQSPLTFGFLAPTILMPAAARGWSADEVSRALRHELEHVRRGDWTLQLLARIACALYWPHPLVWTAWRRFTLEAERACDDAVLSGSEASLYAKQLVTLARDLVRRPRVPAMAMASRSQLARRIDAILDPARSRGPAGKAFRLIAAAVALMVVLGIGPVRLVAAAAESGLMDAVVDGVKDGVKDGVSGGVSGALAEIETYTDVFVEAAEDGDVERLDRIFSATRIDLDTPFTGDGTVLLIAARKGRLDAMRWLLDRGADPNAPSLGDGNPLIAAADRNQVEAMQLLLDRGARVDDVVPGDENALITASAAGHEKAVRLLIRHGANVNARVWADNREWRTPLNMARQGRHHEVEKILLAAGATN